MTWLIYIFEFFFPKKTQKETNYNNIKCG